MGSIDWRSSREQNVVFRGGVRIRIWVIGEDMVAIDTTVIDTTVFDTTVMDTGHDCNGHDCNGHDSNRTLHSVATQQRMRWNGTARGRRAKEINGGKTRRDCTITQGDLAVG